MEADRIYKILGERIKSKRKQLDMTQVEVSDQLGISRASLANIETGRQKVLVHTLFSLARVLGIGVTDLLPDQEPLASAPPDLTFSEKVTPAQKAQLANMLQPPTIERRKAPR